MVSTRSLRLKAIDPAIPRQYALSLLFVVIGTVLSAVTDEKTKFLYKDALHLSASDVATLNLILAIPVYLQPFLGAWTEFIPWFGYHRRPYFVLGIATAALGYLALASLPMYQYQTVLPLLLVVITGGVLRGVVYNAVFTAVGNRTGILPRLQTAMTFVGLTMGLTYTSHLGGYVAEHWSYREVFLWGAGLTLFKLPLLFLIPDPRATNTKEMSHAERERHHVERQRERQASLDALRGAAQDRRFWIAVAFYAFISLTPFPASAQIYYETDVLHFTKQFIGDLNAWGAAGSFLGLAVFYAFGKRLQFRLLPLLYVGMNAILYLCFLMMHDAASARTCFILSGVIGNVTGIVGTLLFTRTCPRGVEGTVFALIAAVNALFYLLCDKWGTYLYDHYGPANTAAHYSVSHGWDVSLWYGFGMSVLAFAFIPFLPAWARSQQSIANPAI